jgi:hypothetical protein
MRLSIPGLRTQSTMTIACGRRSSVRAQRGQLVRPAVCPVPILSIPGRTKANSWNRGMSSAFSKPVSPYAPGQANRNGVSPASENGALEKATQLRPLIGIDLQTSSAPIPFVNTSGARKPQANCKGRECPPAQILSSETSSAEPPPRPCKLLTHLAVNPGADITQMTTGPDGEQQKSTQVDEAVPCSRAYRMLMQYATTEPKLDYVAHILEEGCVPHSGSSGGCSVKNATIWQALDQLSCDDPAT